MDRAIPTPFWTPRWVSVNGVPTHPPERLAMSGTPGYRRYTSMITRCEHPPHKQWKDYGGCGSLCASAGVILHGVVRRSRSNDWTDNGNYEPGAVAWVTPQENQHNTRFDRNLAFKGTTRCPAAWAEQTGISQEALTHRLNQRRSNSRSSRQTTNTRQGVSCS
jgi:hypothetical protein